MNEDKIIADYIRDKFPHMLNTSDFAMYKLERTVSDIVVSIADTLKKTFNGSSKEQLDYIKEKVYDGE